MAEDRVAARLDPTPTGSNSIARGEALVVLHINELRALLVPGRTHCLLGSSGVGKTTLINRLIGRDELDTKAVSGTGEGVHTTSRRQLLVLDGGSMLVDTPGMRELGLLGAGDGVDDTFSDIHEHSASCRFADCTHTDEPGCSVLLAMDKGTLSENRYQNYLKLRKETEFHDLSYGRTIRAFTQQRVCPAVGLRRTSPIHHTAVLIPRGAWSMVAGQAGEWRRDREERR